VSGHFVDLARSLTAQVKVLRGHWDRTGERFAVSSSLAWLLVPAWREPGQHGADDPRSGFPAE